jgi:hypothetical protein
MTHTRKRSIAFRILLSIGLAVTSTGAVLSATAAPAHAAYADCASTKRLCLWQHINAGGIRYEWGGDLYGCWNLAPSQGDRTSSMYNRMGFNVTFYRHIDCERGNGAPADKFTLGTEQTLSYPTYPMNWWFNDEISSVYFHHP